MDGAREAVAVAATAFDGHTPVRHCGAERGRGFQVWRIPAEFDESIPTGVSVGTSHVWGPVAHGLLNRAPHACSGRVDPRRINIVVGSSFTPVARVWVGKLRPTLHSGRNEHGFIDWEQRLKEGNDATRIVLDPDVGRRLLAVRFVGKRLLNIAILVTVETTVLKWLDTET